MTIDMDSPNGQIATNLTDKGNKAPVYKAVNSATNIELSNFRYRTGSANVIGYWGLDTLCVFNGSQTQELLSSNRFRARSGLT